MSLEQRFAAISWLVQRCVPHANAEVAEIVRIVSDELVGYAELILSQDGESVGFLLRGETEALTEKVQGAMNKWGFREAAKAHLQFAEYFNHKRAFVKFEWKREEAESERQIAVYYRRRPTLEQALELVTKCANHSIDTGPFRELAGIVQKESVHFVALSSDSSGRLRYKMYFTQYLTPQTHAMVKHNLQCAFARFSSAAASTGWEYVSDAVLKNNPEQTLYLSLTVAKDGVEPSLKLDFPEVGLDLAGSLLKPDQRQRTVEHFSRLCEATWRKRLSYIGSRWGNDSSPTLKGYAAFP